jgi:hypothetical protein
LLRPACVFNKSMVLNHNENQAFISITLWHEDAEHFFVNEM